MKYSEIKNKIKHFVNEYGEKYSNKNWLFFILIQVIFQCLLALYLILYLIMPILFCLIILSSPFLFLRYLSEYFLQVKDYIQEHYIAEIIIAIEIIVFIYYILFKFVVKPIAKWFES